MDDYQKAMVKGRGLGEVKTVLHTATILQYGWEMDNEGWIVEMEDGRRLALTTGHCYPYLWDRRDAEKKLKETEASAASIRRALELWPADCAATPSEKSDQ